MMQVPQMQPAYMMQPSYNAVKIDVHNPQVNAPGYAQPPMQAPQQPAYTAPVYNYPQAPIYEMPKAPVYEAPKAEAAPVNVPEPVVVKPQVETKAPVKAEEKKDVKVEDKKAETKAPENAAAPVDVKAPEKMQPAVDVNAFIAKLASPDYDAQANAMESIADMAQNDPAKATDLLDVKVVDTLLGIMNKDSSKLQGPTPEQLALREKVMAGKTLTDAENKTANTITPMEQAERNKQYALYTTAMLQKLYANEAEKMTKTVVPMTELPGAVGVVEQLKTNANPMVRAAAVDSLSYIQRPEYKQDLKTLFSIAQTDADANVKDAANKAMTKLDKAA